MEITRIVTTVVRPAGTSRAQEPVAPCVEAQPSPSPGGAQPTINPENQKALQAAAHKLELSFGVEVRLEMDEETGRQVVKIFSPDGQRLLRQIPPEQLLKMAARARQEGLKSLLGSVV